MAAAGAAQRGTLPMFGTGPAALAASVGEDPQDKKYGGEATRLEIGERNVVRECVTLHRGTAQDAGVTRIGNDNLFMAYVHVAHDCQIGDNVIMANAASLAGHLGLGRLICLYDDNEISIEGSTDIAFTEDVPARFRAYGWHVQEIDGQDMDAIDAAVAIDRNSIDADTGKHHGPCLACPGCEHHRSSRRINRPFAVGDSKRALQFPHGWLVLLRLLHR